MTNGITFDYNSVTFRSFAVDPTNSDRVFAAYETGDVTKTTGGIFRPFGQGETPIADVLLLIKKEKWPINVDLELEYEIPKDSDPVREVTKCIEYMRNILE